MTKKEKKKGLVFWVKETVSLEDINLLTDVEKKQLTSAVKISYEMTLSRYVKYLLDDGIELIEKQIVVEEGKERNPLYVIWYTNDDTGIVFHEKNARRINISMIQSTWEPENGEDESQLALVEEFEKARFKKGVEVKRSELNKSVEIPKLVLTQHVIEGVFYKEQKSVIHGKKIYSVFWFFNDGLVIRVSALVDDVIEKSWPKLCKWFNRDAKGISSGKYKLNGKDIEFTCTDKKDIVDYHGIVEDFSMILDLDIKIKGREKKQRRGEIYTALID